MGDPPQHDTISLSFIIIDTNTDHFCPLKESHSEQWSGG